MPCCAQLDGCGAGKGVGRAAVRRQKCAVSPGGHVSGILYIVGQENNSTKNCSIIYGKTRFLKSKAFVLGPGTRMIL